MRTSTPDAALSRISVSRQCTVPPDASTPPAAPSATAQPHSRTRDTRPSPPTHGPATLEKAQADLDSGLADAIAFGRAFIGNPDLVDRLREGLPLAQDNPKTWYSKGPEGYIDYPAYKAEAA
jgi:2,4-dienoyl-CoA reductase-like NADH-dependent reductase (Old Yellow Enzyme family)